jgi:hypothetical protein
MRDVSSLKPIGSAHCAQYNTEAKFYISAADEPGQRHLVVHYAQGGYQGAPEFTTAIPRGWTEQDVIDLLLLPPMKGLSAPYPAWEIPSRVYGSGALFRWWADQKPE